jgi:hypothetical protein
MTTRKARPSPASHSDASFAMDAILIETATNNSPVSVAAALPQISANVSHASKRIPSSAGRTMNARALRPGVFPGGWPKVTQPGEIHYRPSPAPSLRP